MPLIPGFNFNFPTPTIPNVPASILSLGGKYQSYRNLFDRFTAKTRIYPKDFCYIRVLESDRGGTEDPQILFQQMPRQITDSKSALYQDIPIVGRSSPYKSYSGSAPRSISFALDFFAAPDEYNINYTPEVIKELVDFLQALTYPVYENFNLLPPPKCLIKIGDQLSMIGVCKSVSVNYTSQIPWTIDKNRNYSFGASVNLQFDETVNIPLSYKERKAGLTQTDQKAYLGGKADSELLQLNLGGTAQSESLPGDVQAATGGEEITWDDTGNIPDGGFGR